MFVISENEDLNLPLGFRLSFVLLCEFDWTERPIMKIIKKKLETLPQLYFFYVFLLLWLLFVCRLPQPQFGKLVPKTLPLQVVVVKLTKTSFWPPKRIVLTPIKTILKSVEFAEPKCTKWKLTIVKNVPIRKAFVLCVVRKSSKPRITNKVQCRKGENLF